MGQGQRSATTGRKIDNTGEEEHKCLEAESASYILRSSILPSWIFLRCEKCMLNSRQEPHLHMDKLFGPLRERYLNRPGGYTRVLRIEPLKPDQAPSAILELVDGARDTRFAMTAKTLVKQRDDGLGMNEITAWNVRKVTRFREGGEDSLETEVLRLERGAEEGAEGRGRRGRDRVGRLWK